MTTTHQQISSVSKCLAVIIFCNASITTIQAFNPLISSTSISVSNHVVRGIVPTNMNRYRNRNLHQQYENRRKMTILHSSINGDSGKKYNNVNGIDDGDSDSDSDSDDKSKYDDDYKGNSNGIGDGSGDHDHEEEKRLKMLASRRESIRSTLRNADSFKQFRISKGLVSEIDETTGEPLNSDGKVVLTLSAFIIAAGIAILRIGGRAALISFIGIDFADENPEIKATMDAFLDYAYALDPSLEALLFVLAWIVVKVFCFDFGAIILALSSGLLFDDVFRGAIYATFAATIGSSVAYYIAKLDTPIRKRVLILLNQYPSLRGVERVVAEDGIKAVLTLRVAPIIPIPIGAYNYLYGVTDVYYWDFAIGIFLGSLKPYLLDSYLGYYGKELVDGVAGYGTEEDTILFVALGVSALVGVFATQLAAETWDAVQEEVETEALRKGDRDSNGVIKKVLGLELPSWVVEPQTTWKETEREIERMIKAEYKTGVWNITEEEGKIFQKLDPTKFPGSPEVSGAGSGYGRTTSIYNGLTLNPALTKAFFKYSNPLYDNNNYGKRKLYQFDSTFDNKTSKKERKDNKIQRTIAASVGSFMSGKYGMKDEIFFILQVGLLFSIFDGNVPVFGDAISFLLGPGCIIIGGSLITVGGLEMGTNLSPWTTPPINGTLVTSGVFSELRHPMSAGLMYLMLGISILSDDAIRLTLCAVLWYLLDSASTREEEEMMKKFGFEYELYQDQVQSKFIPERVVNAFPLSRWYLTLPPL